MKRLVLVFLAGFPILAQSQPAVTPPALDSLIRDGIGALMGERFAAAESLFSCASDSFPDHPAGPVMQAAVLHLVAEDGHAPVDLRKIDSLHAEAERRGESLDLTDRDGRVALAFIASSRGIVSLEAARNGAWLRALRFALSAASLGEDILDADSAVVDAGLAVGNYYYWKSRRVEVITWLPFVADSRAEGIALLRRSAAHGTYQRFAAMNSLAWILRDAGDLAEALHWVEQGLDMFPQNRSLLRSAAAVLGAAGDLSGAGRAWETVQQSLERDGLLNSWAHYESVIRRAELAVTQKDPAAARQYLGVAMDMERVLDMSVLSERRETLLEQARTLRIRINTGMSMVPGHDMPGEDSPAKPDDQPQ